MNESDKENIKEPYQSPTHAFTVLKQTSFISSTEPNISTSHTFRCIKKRIPWSEEEDKLIKQLVNKYGTSNWTLISSKMGKSRNGKQCRERWYNQLNPSMKKNNWTTKEENILFSKHMQLGNKWADIASFLPGRTLNDIKNHFYSKLRKFIRQILKQINDEKLFQINGIDSCKYTGEKIYKMIKKHDITYKNLTKDTIFELIIATEKNPKGKFIFFNEQNTNEVNEYNNNESTIGINNKNISYNLSNNFFIDETYENYNDKSKNIKNNINNNIITNNIFNNNNYLNLDTDLVNNNDLSNFKLKLRKYSNFSENKSEFNSLNNNNNLKLIQNNKNTNKKNTRKTKQKSDNEIKNSENTTENKLIGKKRKKSKKVINNEEKDKNIPELILSSQKPKKKNKKSNNNKNNIKQNIELLNQNDMSKNSLKEIKFFSRTEKNDKINNINFYPPFNISSPKELKNIQFPFSMTKSIRSLKPEDFSFSNKLNSLNDYLEPSLQKGQMLPMNYDNLLFLHQKNKNNSSLMSDISYDNNLLNMNNKNDNTYKNFSINGNIYNKNIIQNNLNNVNSINNLSFNNNITLKSIDEKEDKKNNEKPIIINMDLINNQDFTNAFINGNNIEINEKSQYNNSVYNKNNNNFNLFNSSLPSSVKNFWK